MIGKVVTEGTHCLIIDFLINCRFKKLSGIDFNDMIFFDDEHRNIDDLTRHGVFSVLVPNGVNRKVLEAGLAEFANKHS